MKCKHLHIAASPCDRFAAGAELQSNQIVDRTCWTVFARNPLRIEQREWSGFDGNSESAVNDVFGSVSSIDVQRYRRLSECSSNTGEKQEYSDRYDSNRFHEPIEPRTGRSKQTPATKSTNSAIRVTQFSGS